MADPGTDPDAAASTEPATKEKESLLTDVMKSMGCGLMMLLLTIIVGGALAVAIIAPWGRANFDCSIYCVIRQYFEGFF